MVGGAIRPIVIGSSVPVRSNQTGSQFRYHRQSSAVVDLVLELRCHRNFRNLLRWCRLTHSPCPDYFSTSREHFARGQ